MKAFTDIEQSKKLAEILPIESADGFYEAQFNSTTDKWEYILFTSNKWASEEVVIPCWSLSALLNVLPLGIYDEIDSNDYELEINMIDKMPRYIRLGDISHSKFPWDFEKDDLLDNIVESIIWLKDNNYFE